MIYGMTFLGLAQIALVFGLVLAAAIPLGRYIAFLFGDWRPLPLGALARVETGVYRSAGVDPKSGQS